MADRILLLLRHGQYVTDEEHSEYGYLTALGERQATRTARRLAEYPIDAVYSSTMPRAIQTTELVAKGLRRIPKKRVSALREGIPTPFPGITRDQRSRMSETRKRMERVYARFFRPTRGRDRFELLVCHGNLIRYLTRRAMGDAPGRWWKVAVMNCGLSIVVIRADGATRLFALNDVGHLPRAMQTHG
jgi:serine/threonine-protein phosphatase PGAM5